MEVISTNKIKVFLGGTWNYSTWRERLIKYLDKDIDYYNPIVSDWNEEAIKKENKFKKESDYNLYCITPKQNGFYSIAELIDDSNKNPKKTILLILKQDGDKIFTEAQWKSLKQIEIMVRENGSIVIEPNNLEALATYLNNELYNTNKCGVCLFSGPIVKNTLTKNLLDK